MTTKDSDGSTTIEMTLHFGNGGRLSPEDVSLVAAIRKHRSILGASRATGVSYRKCWLMVDALNRTFETPVFETFPGRRGGGAQLTSFGERLVSLYESLNRRARTVAKPALDEITGALNPNYQPRTSGAASEHAPVEPQLRRSPQP
jgi:molybdate transport system regulatory protein